MALDTKERRDSDTVAVRVDRATHVRIAEIAEAEGLSFTRLLARAVDLYWREWVFGQADAAYAALDADPRAQAEWEAELALWDCTLMDGLEDEPQATITAERER